MKMTTNSSINEECKCEAYQNEEANSDMVMAGELDPDTLFSWKERLSRKSSHAFRGKNGRSDRSIGYAMLQNKIYALWKPSQPFSLMDIVNGEATDETSNSGGEKMTNTALEGNGLSNNNDV
ncbi:hypothetical protein PVK06_007541 [Gossypium arboreum]|uniref:Uncharacterized protein n=1 Tax=Gossypium arboreum TaxID=29729 RepID=A0ABR0QIJ0_GOSAR|nr:hypothetical protein PVK06_007541 [Gossypium arboreum]